MDKKPEDMMRKDLYALCHEKNYSQLLHSLHYSSYKGCFSWEQTLQIAVVHLSQSLKNSQDRMIKMIENSPVPIPVFFPVDEKDG